MKVDVSTFDGQRVQDTIQGPLVAYWQDGQYVVASTVIELDGNKLIISKYRFPQIHLEVTPDLEDK